MRKIGWLIVMAFASSLLYGQSLSGEWEGYITQEGKADTFIYTVQLQQSGQGISGSSFSSTQDGQQYAHFSLTGYWDGQQLILQEVEQTAPESPKWCVKYATLKQRSLGGRLELSGRWRADGCTPGDMLLRRMKAGQPTAQAPKSQPSLTGKWSGSLSQSDRDYGFYIEFDLVGQGEGQSYIVSEDNGGSAHIRLDYEYQAANGQLHFQESAVVQKEDPRWPWCIKSGTLRYREEESRLVLEGPWQGYIEGHDLDSGPCANGQLYLEKALLTAANEQTRQSVGQAYEQDNQRSIKVQRVVDVKGPNVKIKIWDNGVVDGDIATLFLNGQRVLHRHLVTKRRIAIPVTLEQEANFLVLHADDLGDISPNTVAVSIDDGQREQVIIVSSNLAESGALMIRKVEF